MTLTTTEELKHLASSDNANELTRRLARELLANREAQPVQVTDGMALDFHHALTDGSIGSDELEEIKVGLRAALCNVTAQPAPAVPDDYQHLKNVQELYHSQEERLFSLAQRIKGASFDKYSHSTAQAIDVLEREIFGDDGDACRAAMLENIDKPAPQLDSVVTRHADQPVSRGYKLEGGENCWSCGKHFTYVQHSECDGYCPHCGSPVDIDDEEDHQSKVVPSEPTEEMISSAWREATGKCDHETIKRMYKTMLAAAPEGGNGE